MKPTPKRFVPDLASQGYCWTNRNANVLARIDRDDWIGVLVQELHNSDLEVASEILEDQSTAADYYRRYISEDRIRIPIYISTIPNSSAQEAPNDYRPKTLPWGAQHLLNRGVDTWEGSDAATQGDQS